MLKADVRADLLQQARFMPKSFAGGVSIAGYLIAIAAFVVLINNDFGWFWPLVVLAGGVALTWGAGVTIQKKFEWDATAAGFDAAEIRALENEAERLNEEEYP